MAYRREIYAQTLTTIYTNCVTAYGPTDKPETLVILFDAT